MQVQFKVIRQQLGNKPQEQIYLLDVDAGATVLDCLNRIKWEQDGSLAFRKNCRNTICGSCSMRINGRAALACKQSVGQELSRLRAIASLGAGEASPPEELPTIEIAPMGNMPVIKDLVVDMQGFWGNLRAVDPYVSSAARQIPEREFLQAPADRAKLDQTGNCILCGACYSDCNAREVSNEFVGPHVLAKAYRLLADTRDDATDLRLQRYNQGLAGVWGCTRCFNCNSVCPMDVAPLDQINRIKTDILAQASLPETRSLQHRQVMVDLVKRGGWIDERLFGLRVLSNNFKDLRGLLSLVPLGVRMLQRRKFPTEFHPSTGTAEVRSLITAIQKLQSDDPSDSPPPMGSNSTKLAMPSSAATSKAMESESKAIANADPETAAHSPEPALGWNPYSERINGRFAMIGLIALLLLEFFTHQDFFTWIGLR